MIESHHSRFVCFLYGANDPLIRGEPSCGKLALGQNIRSLGAPLKNFNDGGGGGVDRGSYFIPKKITTSEFVYPKKSLLFLAYPKKSLSPFSTTQKNPSVFTATQKNPGVFHRPYKIPLGQNLRPKKITPPPLRHLNM